MQSKALILPGATVLIIIVLVLGNMGVLPASVTNLWPIILVVAGLVGLTSYDGEEKTVASSTVSSVNASSSTTRQAKTTSSAAKRTKKAVKKTAPVKKSTSSKGKRSTMKKKAKK